MSEVLNINECHPARRYDYLLGGKDNYAADRESGDRLVAAHPGVKTSVLANRAFLRRAVRFLTREAGLRQFLDIGTGLPTRPNVHQVAQGIAPESRIVYVDNDPLVLTHARALLTSSPEGTTEYVDADLRDPQAILNDIDLQAALDLKKPVGLLLLAVMHFVTDERKPHDIVRQLLAALPSGSYLAMSHVTYDPLPEPVVARLNQEQQRTGEQFQPRSREEFERFFTGLELVEPGITLVSDWRPDDESGPRSPDAFAALYSAVARVP
ncbi:SAM-dependent methyltransferase [Actinoplanes sp. ATCC 53533]|uniref:SAM-dependent methyltransferase n=1 Tax=Actinoplanes sp. ATCC 53533 TaxID=1288362 RepID=UPI001F2DFDCC|nr:SAM-dependent methyltransferase [Actinoplanes sp. ATCC 53533]